MRLALLAALALAGCTTTGPVDPHEATTTSTVTTRSLPPSGAACTDSRSTLLGVLGIAGFNTTWEPARVRADLERAGFALRGPEFGVDGQDPWGRNFSFAQSGEPRERYQVEFLNGSHPRDAAIEPAARAQWAAEEGPFNDSLFSFEGATGERHEGARFQPIVVVEDFLCR